MKTGTKSVLFGAHAIWFHPFTVTAAWVALYGKLPSFKEFICILLHDIGYWGKSDLDGREDGLRHPELGARIAGKLWGKEWYDFCAGHSRHYAELVGIKTSKMCWADKYSVRFDPSWFFVLRSMATGEYKEYLKRGRNGGLVRGDEGYWTFRRRIKEHFIKVALKGYEEWTIKN